MAPVTEGLWEDGALIGGRCAACHRPLFPLAGSCPHCGGEDVERITLSDTGTLWAWTSVTTAPPGYDGEVPYGFGVVELPEGLRVITRLTEADPEALVAGQAMRFELVALGDDLVTYAFGPDTRMVDR